MSLTKLSSDSVSSHITYSLNGLQLLLSENQVMIIDPDNTNDSDQALSSIKEFNSSLFTLRSLMKEYPINKYKERFNSDYYS